MAFTTKAKVKRALRIPDAVTDYDTLIDELIANVHDTILADIGGGLSAAGLTSYTAYFDIERAGLREIRLPKWPVGTITTVHTGTNGGATGTLLVSTDYYATPQGTLRLTGVTDYWPVGKQNVKVVWTAGISSGSKDESSLELAEKLTVCELYRTIAAQGISGERIGSYSYTRQGATDRGQSVYPPVAERIISRYRSLFPYDSVVP